MEAILINTDTNVPVYVIFILVSFVVGITAAVVLMLRDKTPQYVIWCSVALNALMIAFGGMLISVVMSGFKSCGLSSVGGAFGAFTAIFILARIIPDYSDKMFKAYGCMIPLMYSVSKLACHFNGCCYGREYEGPFCLQYLGSSERIPSTYVFPVQMCETILFAIIFVIGVVLVYIRKVKHSIFALDCMSGLGKLLLDYLRDSHADNMLLPSANQIMCLVIIGAGALLAFNEPLRRFIVGARKDVIHEETTQDN